MDRATKADLYRHGGLKGMMGFLKGLFVPGFVYMYFFRKASKCRKYSIKWFFYVLFLRKYGYKYGFQIPSSVQIGEGFYIGHFGSIVIHGDTIIGKNCNISKGITIGVSNYGKKIGVPIIGNNVFIGPNAGIFGNVTIGNNVTIGANVVVTQSIADGKTILPASAIILDKDLSPYYIQNTLP